MKKTGKIVLIVLTSAVGLAVGSIGRFIGGITLISFLTEELQFCKEKKFDVNEDGMLMIAAKTYNTDDIQYTCINKEKNKYMVVSEFESDEFTAYKWTYFKSGNKFIDDNKNEIKENEVVNFYKQKTNELYGRGNRFNFIIYDIGDTYLFAYEKDFRPSLGYVGFDLNCYNSQDKSLSLIRTYQGNEVVGLKILSELK